jgi:hypothetical protein
MPQTAATVEERIAVLEAIARGYPKVGWRLCVDQFDPHSTVGHYNFRPRWRKDASGAGQPVSHDERYQFARKALDMAIDWPNHDEQTLGDLVDRLQTMPEEDREKVRIRIGMWIAANPDDNEKAELRERIRCAVFTRRGRNLSGKIKNPAKEMYDQLAPIDPVVRHRWLFARQWVQESLRRSKTLTSITESATLGAPNCATLRSARFGKPAATPDSADCANLGKHSP